MINGRENLTPRDDSDASPILGVVLVGVGMSIVAFGLGAFGIIWALTVNTVDVALAVFGIPQ